MSRRIPPHERDPILDQAKRAIDDPSSTGNPLREPLRQLADAYARALRTDSLTGLLNRRAFFEWIEPELSRSRRHDRPLCILLADIDRFKTVNDRYGHEVGDGVLRETARVFSAALRSEDLKVRWGGEEFLALLPETDARGAMAAAEKLRSLIEGATVTTGGSSVQVTISIGVAEEKEEDPEATIRTAELALQEAKRAGRNRVVLAPG